MVYPLIRVDKRIPDGSIWQTRWGYLLAPIEGWLRISQPAGTRWSNPAGGWTAKDDGMSVFHPDRPFTIACHGPKDQKRFYIDIAHRIRIHGDMLEFMDLFGARALLRVADAALRSDREVVIANPKRHVRRLFELITDLARGRSLVTELVRPG